MYKQLLEEVINNKEYFREGLPVILEDINEGTVCLHLGSKLLFTKRIYNYDVEKAYKRLIIDITTFGIDFVHQSKVDYDNIR